MQLGKKLQHHIGAAALLAVGSAHAAYTLDLREVGGNVVATGSGTITTPASTGLPGLGTSAALRGANALAIAGGSPMVPNVVDQFEGLAGPSSFGSTVSTAADIASGDIIGVEGDRGRLRLQPTHVSGNSLSSSATWTGASFASLGLIPGSYTWTWGTGPTADSFTLNIGPVAAAPVAIPTLSEWGLLATSAALTLGAAVWMRRRCAA